MNRDNNSVLRFGSRKPSFVALVLRDVGTSVSLLATPHVISAIERLPTDVIDDVVREAGLPRWISQTLASRAKTLRQDYAHWLDWASCVCQGKG